jgi:hypothetical protein
MHCKPEPDTRIVEADPVQIVGKRFIVRIMKNTSMRSLHSVVSVRIHRRNYWTFRFTFVLDTRICQADAISVRIFQLYLFVNFLKKFKWI